MKRQPSRNAGSARSMPVRPGRGLAVAALLTLSWPSGGALAQTGTAPDDAGRPWFAGTTPEQRQEARQIFLEGNRLLDLPDYVAAAEKYKEAIAIWDNPGFHYNLAGVQYRLVQPVAAYKSLQQALRHGDAPLSPDEYRGAVQLRELLEQQLARIEIVVDQPAVRVTLDGDHLFTGEHRHREVVLPGPHQLTGRKEHHEPDIHELTLQPGESKTIQLTLRTEKRIEYRRRWPRWIPYVVVGASTLFFVGAGYLDRDSTVRFDRFDDRYNTLCPMGCSGQIPEDLRVLLDSAEKRQQIAIAVYLTGGVVFMTGAVLMYMNREIAYEFRGDSGVSRLTVVPRITSDSIGLSAGVRF